MIDPEEILGWAPSRSTRGDICNIGINSKGDGNGRPLWGIYPPSDETKAQYEAWRAAAADASGSHRTIEEIWKWPRYVLPSPRRLCSLPTSTASDFLQAGTPIPVPETH